MTRGFSRALLALAAVSLTIGISWYAHRPPPPAKESTWAEVEAQAREGGYQLITTQELARLYGRESGRLLIVDTRQDWEYRAGHLQGAVNFPLEPTRWAAWRSRDALAGLLGADKDRTIVFY